MAVSLTVNGQAFSFPNTGDQTWGDNVTNWATAVTAGMLQKAGGAFTLTADANFGASFGLLAKYFTSVTASAAASGAFRLSNLDTLSWRNFANNADLAMGVNSSNLLTFAGGTLLTSTGSLTNNTAAIVNGSGQLASSAVTSATLAFLDATSSVQTQLNGKQASGVAATSIGALDGQTVNAQGLALASQVLYAQSADGTHPGLVNTAAQAFGGLKTFNAGALVKGLLTNVVSKSGNYTLTAADDTVEFTTTATATLPDATNAAFINKIFLIKNVSTSTTVTVNTTSAQTIDGRASATILLAAPYDYVSVQSDGTNWIIRSKKETAYLGVTSSAFTMSGTASGNYPTMTGNSVTLTPGQWTVNYYFTVFTGSAGNAAGIAGGGIFAANGGNSSSAPTALTGVFGNNVVTSLVGYTVGIPANALFQTATISVDVYVTANTSVFVVPVLMYTTASNASVSGTISARRVW